MVEYNIDYFYEILSKIFGDELLVQKQNEDFVSVGIKRPMHLELCTKKTKVKHFAEIEINHINFSNNLITFGYNNGSLAPSAFRYDDIVNFEFFESNEEGSKLMFELNDEMIVIFK